MTRGARLAALLLLAAPAGCALLPPAPRFAGPAHYLLSRSLDLADVFPASVAGGYGLSAQLRATAFAGIGAGWTNNWRAGTSEMRFGPLWWEKERGIPVWRCYRYQDYRGAEGRLPGGQKLWRDTTRRMRASSLIVIPAMSREGDIWFPFLPPYFIKTPWEKPPWSWWSLLDCEASVFFGVAGLRAGISPLQAIDLLFGVFAFDPARDDPWEGPILWPDPGAEPSFPAAGEAAEGGRDEAERGG
ncbi:MAG: hypothetical protein HY812_10960 [Planctomycetes bacterium]|nr:hypothetical protein [Planctomycetota bacterium]